MRCAGTGGTGWPWRHRRRQQRQRARTPPHRQPTARSPAASGPHGAPISTTGPRRAWPPETAGHRGCSRILLPSNDVHYRPLDKIGCRAQRHNVLGRKALMRRSVLFLPRNGKTLSTGCYVRHPPRTMRATTVPLGRHGNAGPLHKGETRRSGSPCRLRLRRNRHLPGNAQKTSRLARLTCPMPTSWS